MTSATALVAATSLIAKALGTGVGAGSIGDELPALQISAGRFIFALAGLLPYLAFHWPGTANLPLRLHSGRVLCGWSGGAFLFAASSKLPLGDANAISFLAPVVTMALSILFLKERVGRGRWAAASIALFGALVLSGPGTSTFQPAAGLALASAVLIGAELVFIKHLSGIEAPVRILAMSNGLGLLISVPISLLVWIAPQPWQWALLALLGLCMLSAQVLFIQANRRSDASYLAPIFYTASLFAALYDYIFFDEPLTGTSAIGIALIITGAALLTWRGSESQVDRVPAG
ncbi:MAG: DMT family transporter [Acidimicrobiales bacterium]